MAMPLMSVLSATQATGRLRTCGKVLKLEDELLQDAFLLSDGDDLLVVRVFRYVDTGLKPILVIGQSIEVFGLVVQAHSSTKFQRFNTVLVADAIRVI
jgi:hypothetical protein